MILNRIRRVTRDGRWIPEIDGLRFIAIMSVLLFHLGGELQNRTGHIIPIEQRYQWLFDLNGNGDRGVRLFFVISGMILAMPFARHFLTGAKKPSLGKYYMRRVTRLEPPYILSAVLFTLMIFVFLHGKLSPGFWGHALSSLFYMHNITYGTMSPLNPVTWSLEVEIQFYILAPLIMLSFCIPSRWVRRGVLALAILLIGFAQYPYHDVPRFGMSILYYLQYFLAGLVLADIFVLDLEQMPSHVGWDVAGFLALLTMFALGHDLYAAHIVLPFVLLILCIAGMRSYLLRSFLANPWIAVIGGMCYSIYLMHFAMMAAIFKVTRYAVLPQLDFLGNFLVQILVTVVPILIISTIYYLLVERPCMDPEWPQKLWLRLTGGREKLPDSFDASENLNTQER